MTKLEMICRGLHCHVVSSDMAGDVSADCFVNSYRPWLYCFVNLTTDMAVPSWLVVIELMTEFLFVLILFERVASLTS